nr:MAG TPA: hypothetical protein [Caudoviricetes sp.]DAN91536.1 MAG TPA: hypothetical protein [Caudoviricetes sp.]
MRPRFIITTCPTAISRSGTRLLTMRTEDGKLVFEFKEI